MRTTFNRGFFLFYEWVLKVHLKMVVYLIDSPSKYVQENTLWCCGHLRDFQTSKSDSGCSIISKHNLYYLVLCLCVVCVCFQHNTTQLSFRCGLCVNHTRTCHSSSLHCILRTCGQIHNAHVQHTPLTHPMTMTPRSQVQPQHVTRVSVVIAWDETTKSDESCWVMNTAQRQSWRKETHVTRMFFGKNALEATGAAESDSDACYFQSGTLHLLFLC